jgi:hypothetical protein
MLHPPGFYFVKKPKRFVILSSDKSSERNLSSFFDIKKPRRMEHLQSEEPFSSDPYFSRRKCTTKNILGIAHPKHSILLLVSRILEGNSGNFSLLVASNQIYFLQEMNFSN